MSKEAIQYELRDAIHEHGPDCIVVIGDDDYGDLLKQIDHLLFYQTEVTDDLAEVTYLGVRVLSNRIRGTRGFIIGSKEDMESYTESA